MTGITTGVVRVSGSSEPADIAAVLAALASRSSAAPELSAYERWRRTRTAALRASRAR
jgi:hypothetical protein